MKQNEGNSFFTDFFHEHLSGEGDVVVPAGLQDLRLNVFEEQVGVEVPELVDAKKIGQSVGSRPSGPEGQHREEGYYVERREHEVAGTVVACRPFVDLEHYEEN